MSPTVAYITYSARRLISKTHSTPLSLFSPKPDHHPPPLPPSLPLLSTLCLSIWSRGLLLRYERPDATLIIFSFISLPTALIRTVAPDRRPQPAPIHYSASVCELACMRVCINPKCFKHSKCLCYYKEKKQILRGRKRLDSVSNSELHFDHFKLLLGFFGQITRLLMIHSFSQFHSILDKHAPHSFGNWLVKSFCLNFAALEL